MLEAIAASITPLTSRDAMSFTRRSASSSGRITDHFAHIRLSLLHSTVWLNHPMLHTRYNRYGCESASNDLGDYTASNKPNLRHELPPGVLENRHATRILQEVLSVQRLRHDPSLEPPPHPPQPELHWIATPCMMPW